MSDNPPQLDALFFAALEIESLDERAAFLESACGANKPWERLTSLTNGPTSSVWARFCVKS